MHEKYIKLFESLAESTAVSAEQVMDYDAEKGDKKGYETAQILRENYEDLKTRIHEAGNDYILNKTDAARLIVGTIIIINQLQDKVKAMQNAIDGYKNDLLPKLQEIVDNTEDDEAATKMANEKFNIKENKEEEK